MSYTQNFTRELVQIQPTNLGTGKFSFRNGVPQIIFDIPMMPKIMNGKSLRIQGTFSTFRNSAGDRPTNATTLGLAPVAQTQQIWIDSRTGVSSAIDYISIANQEGATYEMIKNYNRLCSSLIPLSDSFNDFIAGGLDYTQGATGKNFQQGRMCDNDFDFNIPILAGFLQGTPIDLHLVKGLRITLQLASDGYVCKSDYYNNQADTSADNSPYYELSDVMLTFEAQCPNEAGQKAMIANQNGAWEYNAYSSYYNVVQSSDHNAILNINTSRTIGTIINAVPSLWLNNARYNSQIATQFRKDNGAGVLSRGVEMKNFTYTKGGLRIPLDFVVESEDTQLEGVADSQKNFVELNAIRAIWNLSNELKDLRTELSLERSVGGVVVQPRFLTSQNYNDAVQVYNLGVSYDHITENGLNFKGNPLGIRIQSNLTTGTPHSLFVFVKHKNSIMFRNGQVSVMN